MKVLTNKGRRRLGVPGRPALILDAGQGISISDSQIDEIHKNRTVVRWLQSGILVITDGPIDLNPVQEKQPAKAAPKARPRSGVRTAAKRDQREPLVLPEGVTGEGTELHHVGGGWYHVYVNGFAVTDRTVRKDEAESIATEYEE